MFLDKDMMKWKLVGPSNVTFYYGSEEHMKRAVIEGGSSYTKMANFVVSPNGRFVKNRIMGPELANAILAMGRDEINALFTFMEAHQ